MFQRRFACWGMLVSLALLAGCGGESRLPVHRTQGSVLWNGKPAAGAFVMFHPTDASVKLPNIPRGTVGPDGAFVLSTYENDDGAPAGDYQVTVEWNKLVHSPEGETQAAGNQLPARYAKTATSGLKATVAAQDGVNEVPVFELVP